MDPIQEHPLHVTRREFFGRSACGLGTAALASLMNREGIVLGATDTAGIESRVGGLAGLPHFPPRAKHVIYLFQNGAPTHVELFDYKPLLKQMHGKPVPESFLGGRRFSTMTGNPQGKLMLAPVEPFRRHGKSGAWVSNFMPHTASIADELCFIKSMPTDAVNHAPAITFLLTGAQLPGRPSL